MKANPIGLVIAAISTLVSLFSVAYNRSERFRASIDGVSSLAKEAFAIITEAFSAFSRGFSELKEGNFRAAFKSFSEGLTKSNPISAALTQGKRLKNAFNKGFEESIDKSRLEEQLDVVTPIAGDLIAKGQSAGSDIGGATGDAIVEGINERLKGIALPSLDTDNETSPNSSANNSDAPNPLDTELDQIKDNGKAKLEALKVQLLQQSITQAEYEEKVRLAKEQSLQAQLVTLINHGQQETELYRQTQISHLEAIQEGTEAKVQARLKELDAAADGELSSLQTKFLNRLLTEQELEEKSLQATADNNQRKLELLRELGLQETDAFRQIQDEQVQAQIAADEKKAESAERTADIKNRLEEARTERLTTAIDLGISLLSKDQSARKKHASVIKAFELGKVGVNLASEISGIRTAHAAIPPPLGPALTATRTAIAIGKSLIQANKITRQKFFHGGHVRRERGGYTGYNRLFHDGQDHVVDADVHEGEYVNPKWQVRHPVYGRVIQWLDNHRTGRQRLSFFDGGLVNVGKANTDPIGLPDISLGQRAIPQQDFSEVLSKMNDVLDVMRRFPGTLRAQVAITDIQDAAGELAEIEEKAGF